MTSRSNQDCVQQIKSLSLPTAKQRNKTATYSHPKGKTAPRALECRVRRLHWVDVIALQLPPISLRTHIDWPSYTIFSPTLVLTSSGLAATRSRSSTYVPNRRCILPPTSHIPHPTSNIQRNIGTLLGKSGSGRTDGRNGLRHSGSSKLAARCQGSEAGTTAPWVSRGKAIGRAKARKPEQSACCPISCASYWFACDSNSFRLS